MVKSEVQMNVVLYQGIIAWDAINGSLIPSSLPVSSISLCEVHTHVLSISSYQWGVRH